MKHLSIMIKPASSLCNLRCKYCFYANVSDLREIKSFGIMTKETASILIDKLFSHLDVGDSLSIAFQGGEPTLAGVDFFTNFCAQVDRHLTKKQVNLQYSIQTNGFDISDDFIKLFSKYNFLVGISIDLNKDFHNLNRVDINGSGTFNQINKNRIKFEEMSIQHNVLCVLTNPLAKHPQKVWNFIEKNNIEYVQFIPCLGDLEGGSSKLALTSKNFYSFYSAILPLWFNAIKKQKFISIRFFDDLFTLMLHRQVNSCGFTGNCGIQLVVEADGSVYPCDFYVLDKWKLGSFLTNSVDELKTSKIGLDFVNSREKLPNLCESCEFINICNGGCKRMSTEMYADDSSNFCGYKMFLQENKSLINEIAEYLNKR